VWKEGRLEASFQKYQSSDIYIGDQTGLFSMILPEHSLELCSQAYHENGQSKTRVTLLVDANMDGTDRLPLLVIGKSLKLRNTDFLWVLR
jgi:hypothetical protein